MKVKEFEKIFKDTDFVHMSGSKEEKEVAEYLRDRCKDLGVKASLESFEVEMSKMEDFILTCDGKEIMCEAFNCCGSGEVTGEVYYMPATDPVSIAGAKDKIVLMDTSGIGYFAYQDLVKAGAKAILFRYGNVYHKNDDIDIRDLRTAVVGESKKLLCAMINSRDAIKLVKAGNKTVTLKVKQEEYKGKSHNVVATIEGQRDEYIVLSAHYDTTSLSHGAYDNMTGCATLLHVMEKFANKKPNYGLKFVFCGSEERGLLGSKAFVKKHEKELEKFVLNVNLDMVGSIMGAFLACVSAEDKLAHYISYMGAELGFPVRTRTGVYSSDSTAFADAGVPALSFARMAAGDVASFHTRYDTMSLLSMKQLLADSEFVAKFVERMANSACIPVSREIPESVKKELDEYLFRKRRNN